MIHISKKRKRQIAKAVGVATVIATAASVYFLYGKGGAERRKKVKDWAIKAKKEVLEQLENLREFNQTAYNRVIDNVGNRYKRLKSIDPAELREMVKELKGHWGNIRRQIRPRPIKKGRAQKTQ